MLAGVDRMFKLQLIHELANRNTSKVDIYLFYLGYIMQGNILPGHI